MISAWLDRQSIRDGIYVPKYYDPGLEARRAALERTHTLYRVSDLISARLLHYNTGDELGKDAYGTGDIPFVRTSDISNWEIKSAPKQGVAQSYYDELGSKHDVKAGDLLLVRDGTYLIGTNCVVSALDGPLLFQSHILKFRTAADAPVTSMAVFLAFNSDYVQQQIRSKQFTADIIDTIGQRFQELWLPVPKDVSLRSRLEAAAQLSIDERALGKALIKQFPWLMEECLLTGSARPVERFASLSVTEALEEVRHEQTRSEFGDFTARWVAANELADHIYIPKYYDPAIRNEIKQLAKFCDVYSVSEMVDAGWLAVATGDEIGKMCYGTGDIPFIRTSDFANWELKHDPKHSIAEYIYQQYAQSQDVQEGDVLVVRDGTYLVGQSCMITEVDRRALYCGGLLKVRCKNEAPFDRWYLLAALNSFVVKRQLRSKQFTRDVIDTLGTRFGEVMIPVLRDASARQSIARIVETCVQQRLSHRTRISTLVKSYLAPDPA